MLLSSFEFIPLTEELELLPFRCRDEDLNNFLFDDAKHYLAELMAVTYLFIDPVAGVCPLSALRAATYFLINRIYQSSVMW